MAALEPFLVDVPAEVRTDLSERLRRTRFPNEIAGIRPLRSPVPSC